MMKRVVSLTAVCCAFAVLATTGSPARGDVSILDDLVAYWNLDDNFDDHALAGGDHGGTLQGLSGAPTATFVAGMFGNAIDLDYADNQRIEITGGDENDFDFPGGDVSISTWFQVENFDRNWQALIAKGEGAGWRVARRGDSSILGYAGGSGDTNGGPAVDDGAWHHMVAVSENAWSTRLYIDGALAATGGAPNMEDRGNRMMIGGNPDEGGDHKRSWNGNIDDTAVWSRVLTEPEITALYNGGAGATVESLSGEAFPDAPGHPMSALAITPPQGGAGAWGVREVWDAGGVGNLGDVVTRLNDGAGTIVDYTAPVINIQDSGGNGHFGNDDTYGVVTDGHVAKEAVDNIAVVATAKVRIPADGIYTFGVNSDDGFELAIDGQGVARFTAGRGASDTLGQAELTAGVHDIRVLAWEGGGGASVEVFAAPGAHTSFDAQVFNLIGGPAIPAVDLLEPPALANGWSVDVIYDDGAGSDIRGIDVSIAAMESFWAGTLTPATAAHEDGVATINYSDPQGGGGGRGFPQVPFPGDTDAAEDGFVVGATGDLVITEEGDYSFIVLGDDGSRFLIDGTSGWTAGGIAAVDASDTGLYIGGCCSDGTGTVHLTADTYSMELIWNEIGGGAYVGVWGQFENEGWFLLGDTTSLDLAEVPAGLELVPEPSTITMLLGVAALGLLWFRRRK